MGRPSPEARNSISPVAPTGSERKSKLDPLLSPRFSAYLDAEGFEEIQVGEGDFEVFVFDGGGEFVAGVERICFSDGSVGAEGYLDIVHGGDPFDGVGVFVHCAAVIEEVDESRSSVFRDVGENSGRGDKF